MLFVFVKSMIYANLDLDYHRLFTYNIAQLTAFGEASNE